MDTTELVVFITALPAPAAVAFTFVLAVIVGVSWRGILQGRSADPGKDVPAAQVAAVIVDPTALNNVTAAVKDLTRALEGTNDQLEDLAKEMLIQREINRRI
jgi:hypothetical protein